MRTLQLFLLTTLLACGGGDADDIGVASECTNTEECPTYTPEGEDEVQLECLTQFSGGYCGISACVDTSDCPETSICVAHTDGTNYCFRSCDNKPECNANRTEDFEANCSSNFDWANADDDDGSRACVPPSSGT